MKDEPGFLANGEWAPLSKAPRDLLEQWFLDLSRKSQEMPLPGPPHL
jgi:hypothetical protein